jgi:hypothetical protein
MPEKSLKDRSLVRRTEAATYLLVSLISFAGTVVLTRLFLELTGYPQIGGGELHIAHVLWGGLILFIAALIPLIFANRWVYSATAILSGVGIGLFIDEVGKFITRDNNYFFPPAAPIIYAFFLLTVVVYLRLRRSRSPDPRQDLYQVLEKLEEVLDHDLEPAEKADIERQLERVSKTSTNPSLTHLADSLSEYLLKGAIEVVPPRSGISTRLQKKFLQLEKTYITRIRVKIGLIIALLIAGFFAWSEVVIIFTQLQGQGRILESIIATGLLRGEVRSAAGANWFFVHLIFQILVGLFALISSILLALKKDRQAVEYGSACMVLSLTAVNLLAFFVDQFSTAAIAIFQLGLLLGLAYFRRRFILHQ